MPYKVVLTNGEKTEEIVVKASRILERKGFDCIEFLNDGDVKVAAIPKERILYIKKIENSSCCNH